MTISDYILISTVIYYFLSFFFLNLTRGRRRIRFILALILLLNAALVTFILAFRSDQTFYSLFFTLFSENVLIGLSVFFTYLFQVIFRGAELAQLTPYLFFIVTLSIMIVSAVGFTKLKKSRAQSFCLSLFCLSVLFFVFFILARTIVRVPLAEKEILLMPLTTLLEEIIRGGVSISHAVIQNIITVRKIIPLGGLLLIFILIFRKNYSLTPYIMVTAMAAACLGQSYLLTRNKPVAIYLYILSGLLIMSNRFVDHTDACQSRMSTTWKQIPLITLTLIISLIFGLYKLELYPIRYHPDEAVGSVRIMEKAMTLNRYPSSWEDCLANIKESPAAIFLWQYEAPNARPDVRTPIYSHLAYFCLKLLPVNFITMRTSVVLTGTISVFFLFLIIRLIFTPQIALLSAFLMSICSWHLVITRLNLPYSVTNLYTLICIYFFCKAFLRGRLIFYFLLGVLLSLSTPFYPSFRMLYLLIPVFLFFRILIEKQFLKKQFIGILFGLGGFLFMLSVRRVSLIDEFLIYGGFGADTIFHNMSFLGPYDKLIVMGRETTIAFQNLIAKIYSFNLFHFIRRNYIEQGMSFNFILLPFSTLGFFWCLFKVRKTNYSFLLLWMIFSMIPDIITGGGMVDRRATLIIAPLMALGALGLNQSWTSIMKMIINKDRLYRVITSVVLVIFSLILIATSSANYFHTYYKNEDQLKLLVEFKELKKFDAFLEKLFKGKKLIFFPKGYKHFCPHGEANHMLAFRKYYKEGGKFIERQFEVAPRAEKIINITSSLPGLDVDFAIMAENSSNLDEIILNLGNQYSIQSSLEYKNPNHPSFTILGVTAKKTELTGETGISDRGRSDE